MCTLTHHSQSWPTWGEDQQTLDAITQAIGKELLLAVESCEEQRRAEVMSKHTSSSRAQERGD